MPTTAAPVHVTTVSSPDDLIVSIPYFLEFVPRDSLVLVTLRDTRVTGQVRLDLADVSSLQLKRALAVFQRARQSNRVLAVVFADTHGGARAALARVRRLTRPSWSVLALASVTSQDRAYWGERPGGGLRIIEQGSLPTPSQVPAIADFVAQGIVPFASRDELERQLEPDPQVSASVHEIACTLTRLPTRRSAARAWRRLLGSGEIDPQDVVVGVRRLVDLVFRDALLQALTPATLSADSLDPDVRRMLAPLRPRKTGHPLADEAARREVRVRLTEVVRAIAPEDADLRADACVVLGMVAWADGSGTLASMAVERAVQASPTHRLGQLLNSALIEGMPPLQSA